MTCGNLITKRRLSCLDLVSFLKSNPRPFQFAQSIDSAFRLWGDCSVVIVHAAAAFVRFVTKLMVSDVMLVRRNVCQSLLCSFNMCPAGMGLVLTTGTTLADKL